MVITTTYKANGICLGKYWGGGLGRYKAEDYAADTEEELLKQIDDAVKSGAIDSGMGYEKIIGACMLIIKTTTKIVSFEGEYYTNTLEDEYWYMPGLDENMQEEGTDNYYYMV